ncbi:hypothetical protein DFR35_1185, partial [Sulfurisoma sediminicola]
MATLDGTSGNDIINGTSGDDLITGFEGNDTIDGGAGTDTVVLTGSAGNLQPGYRVSYANGVWTVEDVDGTDGTDGTDTLRNVEKLHFAGDGKDITLNLLGRGEFRVNTTTLNDQANPRIAQLTTGEIVVAWNSDGQDGSSGGIYAQRFDAAGVAIGNEFHVSTQTADQQSLATVAALKGTNAGGFVATWQSLNQDGSSWGVYGQIYDASGNPAGSEFRINNTTSDQQAGVSVTGLADGGFIATWHSYGQDGSSWGVYGQRYDAAGGLVGTEFRVNTTTSAEQSGPKIVQLTGGDIVVVWNSDQDGSSYGIYAQRYNSAGVAQGTEFRINSYTADSQQTPTIAVLADGGFVVAWQSLSQDGSDWGIYGQRYDAGGAAVGAEFRANSFTSWSQQTPSVTGLTGGGFVVTWQSTRQEAWDDWAVYGQLYDASGNRVGGEFRLNTYSNRYQSEVSVVALADGGFIATWQSSDGQDGSGYGIYAQRYNADGTPWLPQATGTSGADTFNFAGG